MIDSFYLKRQAHRHILSRQRFLVVSSLPQQSGGENQPLVTYSDIRYNEERKKPISVPGEGELYYDIRFSVYYARQKQRIKLIINVEAQKEFRPGYSLITRGNILWGADAFIAERNRIYRQRL